MAKIWLGPVGNISRGHVLDCSKAPLEQRLRDYDPLLYVVWNPKKLKGHGCWEVRRRDEKKTVRPEDVVVYKGNTYVYPKYHELNLINHVMDLPHLNYRLFEKLKRMDMWNQKDMGDKGKYFAKQAEYLEAKHDEAYEDKLTKELQYGLKQLMPEMKDFKDYVNSGGDPYALAGVWDKA
jgi:hypothetical protein